MTTFTLDRQSAPTRAQLAAGLNMLLAVAEAIRAAGKDGIPNGHLYVMLIGRVDANGYEAMIRTLKNAGLVTERANLLTWVGPEVGR